MDETLAELLNIILNSGVISSCDDLCTRIEPKFGKIVVVSCELICEKVGIEEFIHLVKLSDFDPIYFCDQANLCYDEHCTLDPCVKITTVTIRPNPVKLNDTVQLSFTFEVLSKTATGEIVVTIIGSRGCQPKIHTTRQFLSDGLQNGTYQASFSLKLQNDPDKHEIYKRGLYKVVLKICEGQCGSTEPGTYVLAMKKSSFKVLKG